MVSIVEFVESIKDFSRLNYTEQVKRFCWYLVVERKKGLITGADIASCFSATGSPTPSSISPFLTSLSSQKPAFLMRKGSGFVLTRHAREMLDPVLSARKTSVVVQELLQQLPGQLNVAVERVFLEETLTCFQHGAFRAAIVMAWNLAYDHLCKVIMGHSNFLADFNIQLPKSFPKADVSSIKIRDDFESLKESQVLQVAKSANIISGSVHKILKEKLDRRNIAAHPSNVTVSKLTAEDVILDLVQNVVLKL